MNSSPLPATEAVTIAAPAIAEAAAQIGPFTLLQRHAGTALHARYDESLLQLAVDQGPVACLWQAERGLVVPRTYQRFTAFPAACEQFAAQGWPVTLRQTGGGIVPQGPGIVNVSLAYLVQGPPLRHSEPGYVLVCRLLAAALGQLSIEAFPAAVEGSFCDGRYNLAVKLQGMAVKIAGTAQMWRRVQGPGDRHVGLVHALVLLDIDTESVTETANAFEAAIGSERRYLADRVVSAAELLGTTLGIQERFTQALEHAIYRHPGHDLGKGP